MRLPGRSAGRADAVPRFTTVARMRVGADRLLAWSDLAATLLFAIEGASAGALAGLDVFGMMVAAFSTALVGGIVRDVLLGDMPPAALRRPALAGVAFAGAAVVYVLYQFVDSIHSDVITVLDALGLGLFAANGAAKALSARVHPLTAVLLGTITGVGGGTVRDVLLNRTPGVLVEDIYAVAALAGAVVFVAVVMRGGSRYVALGAGVAVCFGLRVLSVWLDWNLPKVR